MRTREEMRKTVDACQAVCEAHGLVPMLVARAGALAGVLGGLG